MLVAHTVTMGEGPRQLKRQAREFKKMREMMRDLELRGKQKPNDRI